MPARRVSDSDERSPGTSSDEDQFHIGVRPGDVLASKYQVERILGVGGMGVVVAAHHVQLDTKVALKFLLPEMLRNREGVERFTREARAAVRIKSEHVARVQDVGVLENGAPYMVMEFLEGRDLATWLQQKGPLPVEQAVEFVLQACVALAEAHGLGIVHRDLKPANLFCVRREDGQFLIKVLDFGISKRTGMGLGSDPPGMSITKTSAMMGSPLYMSPEQMQSTKGASARAHMQAKPNTIEEYLATVTGKRRTALVQLRKTIRSIAPDVEECISYRIPAFRLRGKVVAGFCARTHGCSYFPFSGRTLRTLAKEIADYEHAKSALHFDPEEGLPTSLVRKLLKARIAEA